MADRQVRVTLSAQVQGYIADMAEAAKATRETGSAAEKLAQQSQAFTLMGQAAMAGGGMVLGGLTLATKAAIDWDSAWAGVLKTVDGSDDQLAAVESGLRGLTAVLPASHTEIAAVAEAAGQLGIETPSVVAFTKTMIDLGETTNLSSEQAAMSLARFMNIMGTSQDDVSKLGSALVGLGNNFATTESEILEMSMRLSKSGVQIGLSEGEVLGLATALSSVGIEAEAGGSAMSKVMINIASEVETGGKKLDLFAKTAGMSADDFSAKWKAAPAEALAAFVKGLSEAEKQGGSTLGVLAELGVTEVRMRDALLGSAAAAEKFAGAMAMGNSEFEANSALTEEAEKRYETTAAQLDIMKNRIVDAAIGFGEHMLPALDFGAESIGNLAEGFAALDGPMQGFVAWGAAIVGTGLLGAGIWLAAVPKIAEYKLAMDQLNLTGGRLHKTLGFVGKAAGLLAVGGALVAMSRESEPEVVALANALERGATTAELMGEAIKAQESKAGVMAWATRDLKMGVIEVGEALDYAAKKSDQGLFRIDPANKMQLNEYITTLGVLGDEMAKVGEADLPKMQSGLEALSDKYGMTERQQWAFIEGSDSLRSVLEGAAGGLDMSTEKADLLAIGFKGVGKAAEEGAEGTDEQSAALAELEQKAADTQEAVIDLADAIKSFGAETFDLRESNRALEASYESLNALLEANGANFDITTDAGRETEAALDKVANATNVAAAALTVAGGSQDEVNAVLSEGKNRLIDMLAPYMGTRDAAAKYVEQLNLIAPEKVTELIAEADQATADLNAYNATADTIPAEKNTKVTADTADAQSKLSTFLNTISSIPSQITTRIQEVREKIDANAGADGFIEAYANGGISTGIYKGGAPIHKFAEPETIWEAYISGKPDQRDRNRQIWVETGDRLGMDVAGSSAPPVVYVQNPFTGDYLLAKQAQIANREIDRFTDEQGQAGRWAR